VPDHVHEQRYEAAAVGVEAARLAAKVRAEMAREKAATKLQEAYKKRWAALASWLAGWLSGWFRQQCKSITDAPETLRSCTAALRTQEVAALLVALQCAAQIESYHSLTHNNAQRLTRRQELAEKAYQQRLAASSSASQSPTKTNRNLAGSQGSSFGNSSPHKQFERSASAVRSQPHPQDQQEYVSVRRGGSAGSSPMRRANSVWASPRPGSSQGHVRGSSGLNVPDFRALHAHWQVQQAAIKAANRKRVTVPEVGCCCSQLCGLLTCGSPAKLHLHEHSCTMTEKRTATFSATT
jgi:hypothetical protein